MGNSKTRGEQKPIELNAIELTVAIRNNNYKKMVELLKNKEEINLQKELSNHFTPLHLACFNHKISIKILRYLFDRKIDVNLLNDDKKTAFHLYCSSPSVNLEGINLFLENKIDLNLKDDRNNLGLTSFIFIIITLSSQ